MSNNITQAELNNSIVCEAIGCYSEATNVITLNIGSKRTISLFLCNTCRSKLPFEGTKSEILQRNLAGEEGVGNT